MKYCIIGLGQFGFALAKELALDGNEVLAIDLSQKQVDSIKDHVSVAAKADASDIEALRELGANEVDAGVICIGERFESSLMATSHLKSFEIEKIYCRAINPVHANLTKLIGVTEMIEPEAEAAQQFAKRLGIRSAKQRFTLSGDYTIVEVAVPKKLVGTPVGEANLDERHKLVLITIRKNGGDEGADGEQTLCGVPDPESEFEERDYLVVFGREQDVDRFSEDSD